MSTKPRASPLSTADMHPGAGYFYGRAPPPVISTFSSSTPSSPSSPSSTLTSFPSTAPLSRVSSPTVRQASLPSASDDDWAAVCDQRGGLVYDDVDSPDKLLERGIADYTVVPGGKLGSGKFSVVLRMTSVQGGHEVAVKHTPLHPHHPLIASRLIREPMLLAQLPPHPNLIRVIETVKTEGHFYLVEELIPGCVSLDVLCGRYPGGRLPLELVHHILDQLVSVTRDALHSSAVVHRDIKPENVLVHPDTGNITVIDLGLATHFSLSSPKLTTCCGSPAFHSPEIVHSLSRPPGEVKYWGPEVDIWTVALTVLRCWMGKRYPLGTNHSNLTVMHGRVQDALASVDVGRGRENGRELRDTLRAFLSMDGEKRIAAFRKYRVSDRVRSMVEAHLHCGRDFKQTTFAHVQPKYALPLYLVEENTIPPNSATPLPAPEAPLHEKTPPASSTILLRNPTEQSPVKVISFLKYALRCANILYHCRSVHDYASFSSSSVLPQSPFASPYSSPSASSALRTLHLPPSRVPHPSETLDVFQCVLLLPPPSPPPKPAPSGLSSFLPPFLRSSSSNVAQRSSSRPPIRSAPLATDGSETRKRSRSHTPRKEGQEQHRYLVFLIALQFSPPIPAAEKRHRSLNRRAQARNGGRAASSVRSSKMGSRSSSLSGGLPHPVASTENPMHAIRGHSDESGESSAVESAASSGGEHATVRRPGLSRQSSRVRMSSVHPFPGSRASSRGGSTSRPPLDRQHSILSITPTCFDSPPPSSMESASESLVYVHLSDPQALSAVRQALSAAPPLPQSASNSAPSSPLPVPVSRALVSATAEEEDEPPRGRSKETRSHGSYSSSAISGGSSTLDRSLLGGGDGRTASHKTRPEKDHRLAEFPVSDRAFTPLAGRSRSTTHLDVRPRESSTDEGDPDEPLSPTPNGRSLFTLDLDGLFASAGGLIGFPSKDDPATPRLPSALGLGVPAGTRGFPFERTRSSSGRPGGVLEL